MNKDFTFNPGLTVSTTDPAPVSMPLYHGDAVHVVEDRGRRLLIQVFTVSMVYTATCLKRDYNRTKNGRPFTLKVSF